MNHSIQGDVVLVTGAAGGIGRAIVAALAAQGAQVVATDRPGVAPTKGPQAAWLELDVTDAMQWQQVMATIDTRFGALHALVNNAGISLVRSFAETDLDTWRRVQAVNVESVLIGTQAALPLLSQSGAGRTGGSSIVNLSSVGGLRGAPFNAAYCTSKAAVMMLTKSTALEFAALKLPVRVNCVHPGGIETEMMASIMDGYVSVGAMQDRATSQAAVDAMHPIGRMGQPDEIADGVVFLCSPASRYMIASSLVIDGGYTAR